MKFIQIVGSFSRNKPDSSVAIDVSTIKSVGQFADGEGAFLLLSPNNSTKPTETTTWFFASTDYAKVLEALTKLGVTIQVA